jgi:hypothetical protein
MRVILQRHSLLYSVTGALFLAGTLQAGIVTTVNGTGHFFDLSPTPFGCSDAGTTTASCTFISNTGGAFHFASGSYQANAQYGSLDVTSMSEVFDLNVGDMVGTSTASFADTFLLTGGIGSGTLVFVTEYRGSIQSESCDPPTNCLGNASVKLNTFSAAALGPSITNLSFSFTFGTLFNLNGSASAYSSALGDETATTTAQLQIDSIEVLDSSGALVTNYAVTTGSGASYPFVTPEPGNFALVIAALIVLLAIRRISSTPVAFWGPRHTGE